LATAAIAKEKKKSEQAHSDKAYDQNGSPATLRTFIDVSYLIGHGDFLQFRLLDAGLRSPGDAAPSAAHDSTRHRIGCSWQGRRSLASAAAS
jgi:hypothetical protein